MNVEYLRRPTYEAKVLRVLSQSILQENTTPMLCMTKLSLRLGTFSQNHIPQRYLEYHKSTTT